ncbi:MAG: hypothetical protein ACK4OM_01945 [Alphaproteobacteria bacterium]
MLYQNILQDNVDEALAYKETKVQPGKATFNNNKIAHANWNAYRNASWGEWLQSFIWKNIAPYKQYNHMKDHKKAAHKIEQNYYNITSKKIHKAFNSTNDMSINLGNNSFNLKSEFSNYKASINNSSKSWSEWAKLKSGFWRESDITNARTTIQMDAIARKLKNEPRFEKSWKDYVFHKAEQKINQVG